MYITYTMAFCTQNSFSIKYETSEPEKWVPLNPLKKLVHYIFFYKINTAFMNFS